MHGELRTATRDEHAALDENMSRFDLSEPPGYGAFLDVHRAALNRLQPDWRDEDRADLDAMSRCLEADLRHLEARAPGSFVPLEAPGAAVADRAPMNAAHRLGVAYVLRGSRLGAVVLRRRVPAAFSAGYLDYRPALTWPDFLRELEAAAGQLAPQGRADVIHGARLTFALFRELSARRLAALD